MTHPSPRADSELPEFLGGAADELTRAPARPVTKSPGHIPGEAGLWIFILGDMTLFAAIMLAFLWNRRSEPAVFKESAHQLIQPIGAVNALVLLLSSYLVVRALAAHRAGLHDSAGRLVLGAIGCAAVFAGLKAVEYYQRALGRSHAGVGDVLQLLLHPHRAASPPRRGRGGTPADMASRCSNAGVRGPARSA